MTLWQMTILGHLPSLKNSRIGVVQRRPGRKARALSLPSAEARLWRQKAELVLAAGRMRPLMQGAINLTVHVWYRSARSDLDVSLLMDTLQGYVYENDRQVVQLHAFKGVDPKNPRVRVLVCGPSEEGT